MITEKAKVFESVRVLMVEDDQAYILLMKKHLHEFMFPVDMFVAYDGEEALMVLRNTMCFPFNRNPNLILLDLNLPRIDGREVLLKIKADPGLKHIPVLIMTNSKYEKDMDLAYANEVGAYISKPSTFEDFTNFVRTVEKFWLKSKV